MMLESHASTHRSIDRVLDVDPSHMRPKTCAWRCCVFPRRVNGSRKKAARRTMWPCHTLSPRPPSRGGSSFPSTPPHPHASPRRPAVYLCVNRVAAPHEGVELGIGDATLIKALASATGRSEAKVKEEYAKLGDLGLIAVKAKNSQRSMVSNQAVARLVSTRL